MSNHVKAFLEVGMAIGFLICLVWTDERSASDEVGIVESTIFLLESMFCCAAMLGCFALAIFTFFSLKI